MGYYLVGVVLILFLITNNTLFQEVEAVRVIERREKWLKKNLVIQTLPRGNNVGPPSRNPCSNIPGGRGRCTLASDVQVMSSTATAAAAARKPPPSPPTTTAAAAGSS